MRLYEEDCFVWVDAASQYDLSQFLGLFSQICLVAHIAMIVMKSCCDSMVIDNGQ